MKIKNVVCAPGRTGFYFDDQRAIKRGAGHDGMFYIGQPVTEGFSAVRQAGEAISVMLILLRQLYTMRYLLQRQEIPIFY